LVGSVVKSTVRKEELKTKKTSADGEGKKVKDTLRTEKAPESTHKEELKTKKIPTDDEGKNKAKTTSKRAKSPTVGSKDPPENEALKTKKTSADGEGKKAKNASKS
jgi:hypothetical protein